MSLSVDLTTHGREIQKAYDEIISGSEGTVWMVLSYGRGAGNELRVQEQGSTSTLVDSSELM
jgi:hypothetical protein